MSDTEIAVVAVGWAHRDTMVPHDRKNLTLMYAVSNRKTKTKAPRPKPSDTGAVPEVVASRMCLKLGEKIAGAIRNLVYSSWEESVIVLFVDHRNYVAVASTKPLRAGLKSTDLTCRVSGMVDAA